MKVYSNKQNGAVSLFIVVFAALLITVVSISFVSIMVQNQQQASMADLSQSAYDSAQAGVEDAKRALILYQDICKNGTAGDCIAQQAKIASADCNTSVKTLDDVSDSTTADGEVKIQTGESNSLDQSYTCVKIILDTDDYLGKLSTNESDLIALTGTGSFDTVQIQWFSSTDLGSDSSSSVNLQSNGTTPLLSQNSWPSNRPSVLRAQLIQFGVGGASFNLTDLSGASNSSTLFLYPSTVGVSSTGFVDSSNPKAIICSSSLISGGYACSVSLTLPNPSNGGERTAFLRLTSIYNGTSFRITLLSSGANVKFKGVQPEVDSTGRANDLFRRVQSRVKLVDADFPYPEAAVDITGNLCKNFLITDNSNDYVNSCNP